LHLHLACEYRNNEIVKLLLNKEDIRANKKANYGYTLFLHYTCSGRHKEIVQHLLEQKNEEDKYVVDVNGENN